MFTVCSDVSRCSLRPQVGQIGLIGTGLSTNLGYLVVDITVGCSRLKKLYLLVDAICCSD